MKEVIVAGKPGRAFMSTRKELSAPVRVIRETAIERNHLRNVALDHARTTHVMFLDDDTILVPHRGLLSDVCRASDRGMATFAERKYLPLDRSLPSFLRRAEARGWGPSIRSLPALTSGINRDSDWYSAKITFPTNFCIAETNLIRALGGLDESYVGWGYEDVDLANRVLAAGTLHFCRHTATAIHIDHLVHPEQQGQAQANYERFLVRRKADRTLPCVSASLFGIAARSRKRLGPWRETREAEIEQSLCGVKHFAHNRVDRQYAASRIYEQIGGFDVVGIAVYGSAASGVVCRDVDLCVVVGHCRDSFTVDRMPSGKDLEVHMTCLPSICAQLRRLFYLGDNAYLIYFKFSGLQFIHDMRGLARRYVRDCLRGDDRVVPYMMSLYVGLADLALEKRSVADQLALGRHLAAVALLGGRASPSREVVLSHAAAREWLARETQGLAPTYTRVARRAQAKDWLLYPPNHRGHMLLGGSQMAD